MELDLREFSKLTKIDTHARAHDDTLQLNAWSKRILWRSRCTPPRENYFHIVRQTKRMSFEIKTFIYSSLVNVERNIPILNTRKYIVRNLHTIFAFE